MIESSSDPLAYFRDQRRMERKSSGRSDTANAKSFPRDIDKDDAAYGLMNEADESALRESMRSIVTKNRQKICFSMVKISDYPDIEELSRVCWGYLPALRLLWQEASPG